MTPVKRAHPHGKGDIEKGVAGTQHEIFDCHVPEIEAAQAYLIGRTRSRQSDCLFGTVDCQNEAVADTASNSASGNTRTASDLQDAESRFQRKRFDEGGYPLRDSDSHKIR